MFLVVSCYKSRVSTSALCGYLTTLVTSTYTNPITLLTFTYQEMLYEKDDCCEAETFHPPSHGPRFVITKHDYFSGAPMLSKFDNLSSQEILVVTQ